jgi:hypothetical protein
VILEHKRGDTLLLHCQALISQGVPRDLSGWHVRAQLRDARDAVLPGLAVVVDVPAEGRYTLRAPAVATCGWAPSRAELDIEYEDPDGNVISTETVSLRIVRDITR